VGCGADRLRRRPIGRRHTAIHRDHRRLGYPHLRQRRRVAAQVVRGITGYEANMSDADPEADKPDEHGRHELPPHQPKPAIGELQPRGFLRRGRTVFGTLAIMLCLLLGLAIATQVHQTTTGDSLDTARPADLLVLLDSLRQREATLSTEVAELQRSLNALQASGTSDQTAIQNAQARLAALSILIGTVGATGPGVTAKID